MERNAPLRLALVVGVDVAGYSARTETDAAASAREVLALRERLNALAARHQGRVFNTAGDGVMMEFAAARDALATICDLLDERPESEPDVRVGAHLGDVAVAGNGDLLGHGVNVAARLIAHAQPNRALISAELKAALGTAQTRPMRALGEIALAKMQTTVNVFEIAPAGAGVDGPAPGIVTARPAVASIAVLPFVNMSADPEQEFLSDGITEDIITDLSRWPSLAVASRNSTFRFKGQAIDPHRQGAELGVRFLVEGSVRRVGSRIRITAQLIDAETGNHVWADRFDRPGDDLFAVQDEVVRTIVGTLAGRVQASEAERVRRKPPTSLAAYELTLRGNGLNWSDPTQNAEAKQCFEKAIERDPNYGLPHSLLAVMLRLDWATGFEAPDALLERALAHGIRGVELADGDNASHMSLAFVHLYRGSFDLAQRYIFRALELNPANPRNQAEYGMMLPFLGRAGEGLEILQAARRADPYFGPPWYWQSIGFSNFLLGCYLEALNNYERSGTDQPRALAVMAACCAQMGEHEKARTLRAATPNASISTVLKRFPLQRREDADHLAEGLRAAGFPDT